MQPLTLEVPVNMRVAKRGIGGRVWMSDDVARTRQPEPVRVDRVDMRL